MRNIPSEETVSAQIRLIQEKERELAEAIRMSDIDSLDRLLWDSLLFQLPDGSLLTKELDLRAHRERRTHVECLEYTIEYIQVTSDSAISVVVYDTQGEMIGVPIAGCFRYLRFWHLIDDVYRIIGGSCKRIESSGQEK